jgi:hypothetical protein
MNKPKTENLTAWVTGRNLNVFQKADAVIEYNKLLEYVDNLEKAINYTQCCESDSEQFTPNDVKLPKENKPISMHTDSKKPLTKKV